jgi:isopenicillin-N N-acyltransferase like protein
MAIEPYPRVRVGGDARERGRQYGEAARERVHRTVALYTDVFARDVGLDWSAARDFALEFVGPIRALSADYLSEMEGLAEGSGLALADILAINVRSELKIGAMARQAETQRQAGPPDGCTTLAVTPAASATHDTLLAQNWDWYEECTETVVVLEAERSDGPNYVTVVEAGLLAKTGFNAHGVGVVTNLLASDRDVGAPGIPYHVSLRSVMDATQAVDALTRLQAGVRSPSANFMVASEGGLAFVAEGSPGDYSDLHLLFPGDKGYLVHTNHFTSPEFRLKDVGRWGIPSSPFRLERADRLLAGLSGDITVGCLQHVLRDHFPDHTVSICAHPMPAAAPLDRYMTVVAVVMDIEARQMWVTAGPPCASVFEPIDYSDFLRQPEETP